MTTQQAGQNGHANGHANGNGNAGRLTGQICVVTGGIRGFGASIVTLFASHGAKCLVLDLLVDREGNYDPFSVEEPAASTSVTAQDATASTYAMKADVTSRADWEKALETSKRIFGAAPTVIVNNAGWTYSNKPTLDVSETEFDRVFNINVKSVYLSVDVMLPAMLPEQGGHGGSFVNISSTAALRPRPGLVWYNATKGAVSTATKALAVEYAPQNVRFNCVCPVAGNTPLLAKFAGSKEVGDHMDQSTLSKFAASIPIGRLSEGRDIANACLFLADKDSSFITGIDLAVDGGRCV
ncbi:NAD(P)-binding protein [Testicularia cyperi]|uniref:NAD(P)-binding protein n=1 Tax=Testicularia cyperi TaxID=1882483 RepID=A0A317XLK2_9BASI|nr:NAD(P)-binding protein [Testicularia cyperi]